MSTAAAIVGAGVLGAQASKSAARTAAGSAAASRQQIAQAGSQARRDVQQLFPQAQKSLLTGSEAAFDVFSNLLPEQQRLLSQGNIAAQGTTARGFDQTQAALLGLPVPSFEAQSISNTNVPQVLGRFPDFSTPAIDQGGINQQAMFDFLISQGPRLGRGQ